MNVPKQKIPAGILGATGSVGQKFIELLDHHPWFEVVALTASDRSAGKPYRDAVNWFLPSMIPADIAAMRVRDTKPDLPCKLVFSALDASIAGDVEREFAEAGYYVISNARNHRMSPTVPLLVPEVNPDHLRLIERQSGWKGKIITNPNCSTTGLVVVLKPIMDRFGLQAVHVVTMQALSGAGYPGVASLDAIDNVIPYIAGEEPKMEQEPLKILGRLDSDTVHHASFAIGATCNRVPVSDGHMECVSLKLSRKADPEDVIQALESFRGLPQELALPTAPERPVYYFREDKMPQPRLLRNLEKGMAVSVGRLRKCPILDIKFTILLHNTIRGAAGGAILNAELLVSRGYLSP